MTLAIEGNVPAFAAPIHVGRPFVPDPEKVLAYGRDILERRWLTNQGACVCQFEADLAERLGVRHVIAMCNGTLALAIAVRALGMANDVIVPSFTFVATAHALQWQGIRPVFADVDPATHNLSPASVESLIGPNTSGIVGVHLWGRPCDTEALQELADRHGLRLMYDAAHALFCTHGGRMIGGFGEVEVFSFHATKFLNTFEGGAVATDNDELAERIRLMRNFGFSGYDNVIHLGINGKMNEFSAAMGLVSLEALPEILSHNRACYLDYRQRLANLPGLTFMHYPPNEQSNYQYCVVEVDESEAGLDRDQLVGMLHAENVLARRYFHPGCHRMEPYYGLCPEAGGRLPATERLSSRVFVLPTGAAVNRDQIPIICDLLAEALSRPEDVAETLRALPSQASQGPASR